MLFQNGRIHTLSGPDEVVEALAVKGERILFAGSEEDAKGLIGPKTRVIDLQG